MLLLLPFSDRWGFLQGLGTAAATVQFSVWLGSVPLRSRDTRDLPEAEAFPRSSSIFLAERYIFLGMGFVSGQRDSFDSVGLSLYSYFSSCDSEKV